MWSGLRGRSREVHDLAEWAQDMGRNTGPVAVLVGAPGVGKTRLLTEGVELVRQAGLRVLRARASEADRTLPYGVIRQLADNLGREVPPETLPHAPAESPIRDEAAAALWWYLYFADVAASGPLALCIDDLQWADEPSLRVLDVLRVRSGDAPILVLAAARELPPTWSTDASVFHMPVRPLEPDGVARMLADILGAVQPDVVDVCMEVTRGNPLLVRELARALRTSSGAGDVTPGQVRDLVPETLISSTHARVAGFGDAAVRIAEALALLGDGHDLAVVAELAGVDEREEAAAAVDRLAANGLLQPGRPLAFEHPLLLAAVRDAIPASRRSELHRRAMCLFRDRPGGLDRSCAHALSVDPAGSTDVVTVLRAGAARAMDRAAAHTAVTYLRRAMAEPPLAADEADTLLELATAAYTAQEPDTLELARLAVERACDASSAVRAAIGAGHLLTISGRGREGAELLLSALDADDVPDDLRTTAFAALAIAASSSVDAREPFRPLLTQVTGMAAESDSSLQLRAIAAVELAVATGSARAATEMAARAWDGGELLRQTGADQPFVHSAALAVAVSGDLELLDMIASVLVDSATATGSLPSRLISLVWPAWLREANGDLAASEAYARECIELAARAGVPVATSLPVVVLANAVRSRHGPEAAEKSLQLVAPAATESDLITAPMYWLARAAVNCELGRHAEALTYVGEVQRWQRRWPAPQGGWTFWEPYAAEAHLAGGDLGRAREVASEGVSRAREFGARRPLVHALRGLALTSAGDERASLLSEAIELCSLGGCGADEANLRLARANGQGGRSAIDDLQKALDICDRTGAGYIASKVVGALTEAGARPRRAAVSGIRSLTPAERRVVDLAGSGATNRAIAETLFLTEKTVESHLTAAYRKLGIRSRAQLASVLDSS